MRKVRVIFLCTRHERALKCSFFFSFFFLKSGREVSELIGFLRSKWSSIVMRTTGWRDFPRWRYELRTGTTNDNDDGDDGDDNDDDDKSSEGKEYRGRSSRQMTSLTTFSPSLPETFWLLLHFFIFFIFCSSSVQNIDLTPRKKKRKEERKNKN